MNKKDIKTEADARAYAKQETVKKFGKNWVGFEANEFYTEILNSVWNLETGKKRK